MLGRLGSLWFELKRVWFVLRLRLLKLVRRSSLRVEVERGVRVEGHVIINLYRGSAGRVRIGAGSRLGHGVLLLLDGGDLDVGPKVHIRNGVVLHVRGHLQVDERVILSYYSVIHCDEHVHIGPRVGIGEHTTITDMAHLPAEEGDWWVNHYETAPVELGADVWGGSKATVGKGVTVGAGAILGASSVVLDDVPPDTLVAGAPARPVGPSTLRSKQT